jgi:hypothetical protein
MGTMSRIAVAAHGPSRTLAFAIAVSLVVTAACEPADAQTIQPVATGTAQMLTIEILEGEGALNNIRQRDAREPIVQVTDENHKPVAGLALLFLIHGSDGATASFSGSQSLALTTNGEGIARVAGMQLGRKPGNIAISVSATVAGVVVASAVIHQTNVLKLAKSATQNSSSQTSANGSGAEGSTGQAGGTQASTAAKHGIFHLSKTTLIVGAAVVAAAAVVGIIYATKGNGATSITLGTGTVGHP